MKLVDIVSPPSWGYPKGPPHPREGLTPSFYTLCWITYYAQSPVDNDRLGPERFPDEGTDRLWASEAEKGGFREIS